MFSQRHLSPQLYIHQRQTPCDVNAQPSKCRKLKRYPGKTKICSLRLPISENLPSKAHSQSPSTFLEYVDGSTAGHWLQSCSKIEEVKKVHTVVLKYLKDPGVYVNNNLISMYIKFGNLKVARGVFDDMSERNVVSWTAMLNGYERHGDATEALSLFMEFVNRGFLGNAQTYVCILNLCSRVYDFDLGRQLHARIIKTRVSNLILDCAVLHFYARCCDLDSAFEVFDRIQNRDLIVWTTMITACSQNLRGQEAFVLLSEMLLNGLDPNEFTLCSVLNACGEEKELRFGKQIHSLVVKRGYVVDVYIGTSLVDMYAKCAKIDDSRAIFDSMNRRNAITWNSIISGYAQNGMGDEAISLFVVMTRLKVPGNSLTMVSILRSCGLLRALSTGKEVHAQIVKKYLPTNIFIGSALVWFYFKCRDYTSASDVLRNLSNKDVVSWTAMISGCSGVGHEYEALEYLKKMLGEGVEPNSFTYSSALKACAKLEDIQQGKLIHSSINKTPALSNVFVGSALVNMYSKCGYLPEAVRVFDSMPEKNLVSWKAMIVAYARNGLCDEALKLVYRMRAEGVDVDDYVLSVVLTSCGDFKWHRERSSLPEHYVMP
ncbi:pentatricopeptide repeat-containing protein At4g18520, chloroplastic-like [Andrographis paniculata]|uniref:pentatricopeptide repeat-containing protein At4g18520, chloroplastic-like n=1 Tax=Andrographis paniculata TaxID=175694 RepID=UPI0021E84DAB|nr:pentatricopeptide repeat-containing protein At4g18520, chloroplastic-like [Andrographis paniculata]XP_051138991.1 pentatricopeptide repeat-containing protein At4g18520, chloroplastic-like [Andrographis paniculata]